MDFGYFTLSDNCWYSSWAMILRRKERQFAMIRYSDHNRACVAAIFTAVLLVIPASALAHGRTKDDSPHS